MDSRRLTIDQEDGYPVEQVHDDGELRVFRSGGKWYYQGRGSSECYGPCDTAEVAREKAEQKVARIFEECTGKYHVCDEALDYLDARGSGYDTRGEAIRAAASSGYTHATGSGCPWEGVEEIYEDYVGDDEPQE